MPSTLYQRITLIAATLFLPALIQAGPAEAGHYVRAEAGRSVQLVAADCVMERANASWMRTALDNWESVRRQDLHVDEAPLPWIIFFDASCAWHLTPQMPAMRGAPHNGHVTLPDDSMIDVKVTSAM